MDYLKKINKKLSSFQIELDNDIYYFTRIHIEYGRIEEFGEKTQLNWKKLYDKIKNIKVTDNVDLHDQFFDNMDEERESTNEGYGTRIYYPVITVTTPKTKRIKFQTTLWDI